MELKPTPAPPPSTEQGAGQGAEQLLYAALLERATQIGLVVLALSFAAYMFGWLPASVTHEQLAALWAQPVGSYLQATGSPTGWGWIVQLAKGDMAALAGIALLAGLSVPCLLALVPLARRHGDKRFAALCIAEALVIVLAASGWIAGGH